MNWTTINPSLEESKAYVPHSLHNTQMKDELNENEIVQIKKFQDPAKSRERQAYINLLTNFGDLLVASNITELIDSVFSKDCEFFLFSSTGRIPAQYCHQLRDLPNLFKGRHIQERRVRESYIDLEKGTACQLCNFKILYEDEDNPVDEIVAEVFTIKNNKISKYRAFASKMTPAHGESDPFEITSRDRVLAMVRQINYALAGQPNFERVAALLNNDTQYKIWSWDSKRFFLLDKQNLADTFKNMQENIAIKSIVPYEVYTQSQTAVASYVYHLEGKTGKHANKKYVWLSTCYYQFDNDYKITKVSQQGELYLEGGIEIPFTVHSGDKLVQKVQKVQKVYSGGVTPDLFYNDVFAINVISYIFGPEAPYIGLYKGTAVFDRLSERSRKNNNKDIDPRSEKPKTTVKLVQSIVDSCDSGHDVVILIHRICREQDHAEQESDNNTKTETVIVTVYKLEYGKIMKVCGFITPVPGSIPASFDDN